MNRRVMMGVGVAAAWFAGCQDDEPIEPGPASGNGDASVAPDGGGSGGGDGVAHDAHFAALSDNYTGSVVISLLGADGSVVDDAWLSPKLKNADLRTPFSNDVVLPTVSPSRRFLTAIERGLGVVSRFDLESGKVVGQMKTDDSPEDDMAAFHSNPQDVFYLDDSRAWTSRWSKNLDPDAPAAEQGNDLIAFDPGTMKRTDARVDLTGFDVTVTEIRYDDMFNPIGEVESTAWARPSRLVPVGDHLVVGLVRMTDAYTPAEGATAVVDPATGKVTDDAALDGLKNCGDVYPVADAPDSVLVGCIGDYNTGLGPETGIVRLDVDASGKANMARAWLAKDHDGAAPSAQYLASLGGDLVFAVASGSLDLDGTTVAEPDRAYVIDLATGAQDMLFESDGAFSIGLPAFDSETGVLLVPDAGSLDEPTHGVRRFHVDGDEVKADGFVEVAPDTDLAVRQVHKL
jgi:hypothetical protein